MAFIRAFTEKAGLRVGWRTEVECGYCVGEHGGTRVLHLETYGSADREIPGKVSQSLEVDEQGAGELLTILLKTFPDLRRRT